MKRRDFILSAVVGIGVVSIATYYFFDDVEYDHAIARPGSLSLIWNDQQINSIGKQYREQVPTESSETTLVKLLKEAGPALDEKISSDFETHRTVIIDGWILSETEARQCALESLVQSK